MCSQIWTGSAPPPKGLDLGPLPSTDKLGRGSLLTGYSRSLKVTETWGPAGGLQGGGGESVTSRLWLCLHINAPRTAKFRTGLPLLYPAPQDIRTPPPKSCFLIGYFKDRRSCLKLDAGQHWGPCGSPGLLFLWRRLVQFALWKYLPFARNTCLLPRMTHSAEHVPDCEWVQPARASGASLVPSEMLGKPRLRAHSPEGAGRPTRVPKRGASEDLFPGQGHHAEFLT